MNIRQIIREEVNEFEWTEDIDPYKFIKDYYETNYMVKNRVRQMINDYVYIRNYSVNRLHRRMKAPENMSYDDFGLGLKQYVKDNSSLIKRIMGNFNYSSSSYDHNEFIEDILDGQ
jgi:hypothetical protein